MTIRQILSFTLCLLLTTVLAQPDRHGCYVSHQGKITPKVMNAFEKAALNASIARSDTFDIIHYEITLDATDYNGATLKANTVVTFEPLMAGQTSIRFDLKQLSVDSVLVDGTITTFNHVGDILHVDLPSAPAIGQTVDAHVYYQGSPYRDPNWGGFYFEGGIIYNLGIGLTTIPPNFGKVWYPCFDSFVERATYRYHVTTAQNRKAWCQGEFLGEVLIGGDTVQRSFELMKPIPPHASAIAAADYAVFDTVHTGAYGQVPIRLQGFASNINNMRSKMVDVYACVDALEFWYGQNPYDRVGYTLTTDGALEIPECIAYPTTMPGASVQQNRNLLAHELGHFWWGDYVTPYNHNDMWLKEGPAEYSQHLTQEWVAGREAFLDMIKDNLLDILSNAHADDDGYQPLSPMPDAHIYGTHTYYKGAAMMHNVRGYMGDSLFRQAMHGVQDILAEQTMTPEQFRDSLTAITGVDMVPFFDDWIFQPGYSVFVWDDMDVSGSPGNYTVDLVIRQLLNNANTFHTQVPLDLTLVSANNERQNYTFTGNGEFTNVSVNCSFEPSYVVINGEQNLNMSKLDHEFNIIPGTNFSSLLPYVSMRLYDQTITDTTYARIEHIWAGPSADNIGWGLFDVSTSHYWQVKGNWPAGTELRARVQYDGSSDTELDFDLLQGYDENDIRMAYRATPQDQWEVFDDITINTTGSAIDQRGFIFIDTLRVGEYAFAVGNSIVGIEDEVTEDNELEAYPVPAQNEMTISGHLHGSGLVYFTFIDASGKRALVDHAHLSDSFLFTTDISDLPNGAYVLEVRSEGELIGTKNILVER
jgi:aminopeptidase N